jgi:hypothetical protein
MSSVESSDPIRGQLRLRSHFGLRNAGIAAYALAVSKKSNRIASLIESYRGSDLDAHYLAYFECFNRGLFYEAHDVLEELWLADRRGANGAFYKGLIQLAGAFVHLQKGRLRPAGALLKLGRDNLRNYPGVHERLDVTQALSVIEDWLTRLERTNYSENPLTPETSPKLTLAPA